MLKGAILGVDIAYNPSPTKAVVMDIYPIKLPTDLDVFAKSGENEFLSEIDDMLQKREILAHLEIINLGKWHFDGFIFQGLLQKRLEVLKLYSRVLKIFKGRILLLDFKLLGEGIKVGNW